MRAKAKSKDKFKPVLAEAEKPAPEPVRPDRVGKKPVHVYLEPQAHYQLRRIALDNNKTSTELLKEALNVVFKRYGGQEIA